MFDPRGGYLKKGGVYMPSIVAEIGAVLERHLIDHRHAAKASRWTKASNATWRKSAPPTKPARAPTRSEPGDGFPAGAQLCGKCNTQAVVQMDGCATCLNCGHSKCG